MYGHLWKFTSKMAVVLAVGLRAPRGSSRPLEGAGNPVAGILGVSPASRLRASSASLGYLRLIEACASVGRGVSRWSAYSVRAGYRVPGSFGTNYLVKLRFVEALLYSSGVSRRIANTPAFRVRWSILSLTHRVCALFLHSASVCRLAVVCLNSQTNLALHIM